MILAGESTATQNWRKLRILTGSVLTNFGYLSARGPFRLPLADQRLVFSAHVTGGIHLMRPNLILSAVPSSQGKLTRFPCLRDVSLAHKPTILEAWCREKLCALLFVDAACLGKNGKIWEKKYPKLGYFVGLSGKAKYSKSLFCLVPRKGLEPPQCCHH